MNLTEQIICSLLGHHRMGGLGRAAVPQFGAGRGQPLLSPTLPGRVGQHLLSPALPGSVESLTRVLHDTPPQTPIIPTGKKKTGFTFNN